MNRRVITPAAIGAYIGTITAANWAITHHGPIPVWPGIVAPAGVLFAGLAFTLRDTIHENAGPRWTLAAIAGGTALSLTYGPPRVALAAAVAFALSELADLAVYTPLRRRSRIAAVAASNTVGFVADSVLFLSLAFGSLTYLPGQIVGKAWATAVVVAAMFAARAARRRRAAA